MFGKGSNVFDLKLQVQKVTQLNLPTPLSIAHQSKSLQMMQQNLATHLR